MTKTPTVAEMLKTLKEANKAYRAGNPVMSDYAFDKLEDMLRAADPTNKYFKAVGASISKAGVKIQHEVPMLSAGKAKTADEAWGWLTKIGMAGAELLIEPKVDGLSATIRFENGQLKHIATRGDGAVGEDVSHISTNAKGFARNITDKNTIEVRGELYLPKDNGVYDDKLRNKAVGIVGRKSDLSEVSLIRFLAYQVIGKTFKTEYEKFTWLQKQGFNTPQTQVVSTKRDLETAYKNYLDSDRAAWKFETDGLMLVLNDCSKHDAVDKLYEVRHHHHYNLALKPPSVGKETTLLGIEWNVSRIGKLIPVALVEPVEIGGVTVQRCTLNNCGNVEALKLHKGDKVMIQRANDVIPFFERNLTAHKSVSADLIPTHCPSCGGAVEPQSIHLVCTNDKCIEQAILKIVHWVKNCEMEAFSEASIRALFSAKKIKTIKDLYSLTEKDFDGVEGFAKRKTENAIAQIENTKSMNIRQFVDRLGIDLVGERAMEKLKIETAEELLAFTDTTFRVGENLVEFIKDNRQFVKDLLACVDVVAVVKAKAGGKMVCMTGAGPKTRNELLTDIKAKGDVFIDRVTKDVQILVCEDIKGGSTKLEKARKLGVKLMSYEEYFK